MVRQALEWDCGLQNCMGPPEDISDGVREKCSNDQGVLYGTGELNWCHWYIVEGQWFSKVDLNLPECCGFFPRQSVCRYLANPDDNEIDEEEMLSIEEYQALEAEVKKAYQYFEYTAPYGNRKILRDFKQAVMERMWAYNSSLTYEDRDLEVGLNDIRVLVLEDCSLFFVYSVCSVMCG